ncbi:MAG: peptide MFS transporter [Phaeodactylibacter sp.]|nr:peptide MFS transporter [Phaeodactylibacter sp.]MCB9274464.1 peptide MFS transporter [Lewinellaceae bacterium]
MAKTATFDYDGPRWLGHPVGLFFLFFTELWERFSYFGMRGILVLFLVAPVAGGNAGLGWGNTEALALYGWYTMLVYLAAIPGGLLADRWLGQKRSVMLGGGLLCVGHLLLAFPPAWAFYTGLSLIILGVGALKPNIAPMVGGLYRAGDDQRDVGFTLFYTGINIGALLASLLVGWVGVRFGWHLGFGLAGIGMLAGQLVFIAGQKHLKGIGEAPNRQMLQAESGTLRQVYQHRTPLAVAGISLLFGLWLIGQGQVGYGLLSPFIGLAIAIGIVFYRNANQAERDRLLLAFLTFGLIILFWGAFEQAGGLLNLYAQQKTARMWGGFEVPAPWFQSLNPLYIILFGAPVGLFWLWWRRRGRESFALFKMAVGTIIMGLGFLLMAGASAQFENRGESAMFWLVLAYLLHTLGELCASPVALSFITRLSPARYVSFMMGFYFAATGLGNKLAGMLGELAQKAGELPVFTGITAGCLAAGLLLMAMLRPLKQLAHGAEGLPASHFEEQEGFELADTPDEGEEW